MNSEYGALVAKVDAFARGAFERSRAHMTCAPGCDSCCSVWLTVNQVESAELRQALARLEPDVRERVAARGRREAAAAADEAAVPRCAMLEDNGKCAVYEQRPLVCRTQGYALRYPAGFIPVAAVKARSANGEVTYCPLNFVDQAPPASDVLDAERVDELLALVSQRFARANGLDPNTRHALSTLAAQAAPVSENG